MILTGSLTENYIISSINPIFSVLTSYIADFKMPGESNVQW